MCFYLFIFVRRINKYIFLIIKRVRHTRSVINHRMCSVVIIVLFCLPRLDFSKSFLTKQRHGFRICKRFPRRHVIHKFFGFLLFFQQFQKAICCLKTMYKKQEKSFKLFLAILWQRAVLRQYPADQLVGQQGNERQENPPSWSFGPKTQPNNDLGYRTHEIDYWLPMQLRKQAKYRLVFAYAEFAQSAT